MSSFRQEVFWLTLSSVAINLLALATPIVMLQVFDRILAKGSIDTLTLIMSGAAVAICAESLLRVLRSYLSAWSAAKFEHRAMMGVTSRMLATPMHEFERSGIGAHQDHFKAAQSLKSYYSGQTYQQIIDLPFVVLYIAIVAVISPWLGLLLLVGYLLFSLLVLGLGYNHRKRILDRTQADMRRSNFLVETLANIHTLKSMSMEALMLRRYERLQETSAKAMSSLAHALDMAAGIGTLFSSLMSMLTVALGAYLVIDGRLTTGELAACIMLGFRSLGPLQQLGGMWARRQQESVMREDLVKVMAGPELNATASFSPITDRSLFHGKFVLENVSYQFPGTKEQFLNNVSLQIEPGECLVINGDNGSGRTTLMHLLCGLIQPTGGTVRLDDQDLQTMEKDTLHRHIAYLPQRTHLFEGTLLENITVFDPARTDEALNMARTLKIDSFVSKMPRGWDSQVGDASSDAMPPGHRQRIAIVRALSSNPDIILFDDATTTVDPAGETWILDYLKSIKGKCTLVIVSHRPSLQRLADRAVTLADGKLIESSLPTFGGTAAPAASVAAPDTPLISVVNKPLTTSTWERSHATMLATFKNPSDLSACLPVLLKSLGWRRSPREMAETLPYFTDTLDLAGLENAMAQLGYRATHIQCRLSDIDPRVVPCLFLPDKGPAFVVQEHRGKKIWVADDVISEPREINPSGIYGHATFFIKMDDLLPTGRSWVGSMLDRFRPLILQAGLASVISGLVMATGSLFMMVVYNQIIPTASVETLIYMAFGVFIALMIGGFFTLLRSKILATLAGRIDYLFGTTILQKILSLSPGMTERVSVGSQIARLSSFEAIRDVFTGPLASTLLDLPATLVVLIILGIINPAALLVFLVVTLIYAGLYWWLEPISANLVAESGRAGTRRNEFIIEMSHKMRTIRECGATHSWLERFRQVSAQATMASYKVEQFSSLLAGLGQGIVMISGLAIITITVPLTLSQTVGPGALIASMILMWRVLGPMQTAFANLTKIERIRGATRQIEAIMRIRGERLDTIASPVGRGLKGRIEFARVSFRYAANVDPALIGATFTIQPGEIVAITGDNGSGKSTLIKMLLGMYQPQAGSILIDGVDIRQLDPTELRRLIGYAPQDTQFFRATLSQNLRLVKPDATEEELLEALDLAGVLEQAQAMPNGLQYRIGDNVSEQLPASLRQKLALARAYLTQAPIMLFDEPGTGLDNLGDAKFMETLQRLRGNTTVLFVTHRPSHMRLADRVLVFEGGYLRADGKPDVVLKMPAAA